MKVPNPAPGQKKTTRHYYYVCDVGPGGRVLRQPRLSFRATVKEDNPTVKKTVQEDNPCPDQDDIAGIVGNLLTKKSEKSDDQ